MVNVSSQSTRSDQSPLTLLVSPTPLSGSCLGVGQAKRSCQGAHHAAQAHGIAELGLELWVLFGECWGFLVFGILVWVNRLLRRCKKVSGMLEQATEALRILQKRSDAINPQH